MITHITVFFGLSLSVIISETVKIDVDQNQMIGQMLHINHISLREIGQMLHINHISLREIGQMLHINYISLRDAVNVGRSPIFRVPLTIFLSGTLKK
jgi:hypothetical protein